MLVSFFRRSKSSLSNIASSWLLGKGESSWSAVCTLRMDVVELHGVCIVILGSWKEWTLKNLWQRCLALKCYPMLQIPVFLPFNHLFLHPEALTGSQHWAANSYSFLEPLHLPCKLGGFFLGSPSFFRDSRENESEKKNLEHPAFICSIHLIKNISITQLPRIDRNLTAFQLFHSRRYQGEPPGEWQQEQHRPLTPDGAAQDGCIGTSLRHRG